MRYQQEDMSTYIVVRDNWGWQGNHRWEHLDLTMSPAELGKHWTHQIDYAVIHTKGSSETETIWRCIPCDEDMRK